MTMRTKLLYLRDVLRTSFWFIPGLLLALAGALAFATVWLDRLLEQQLQLTWDWTYTGGAEGARAVLSTIAGSMITVAGVVFSITIVALTLATSQFGPRLLRNFIRDRANQVVLGTFIATFLYCLLVLRTVRGDDYGQFVPSISVLIGVILAVVSLGVLIYFIHHMATSIQAAEVIGNVSGELERTIHRLFPEKLGENAPPEGPANPVPELKAATAKPIRARHSGYIVTIDNEGLLHLTREHDLVVQLLYQPGNFLIAADVIAWAWPADRTSDEIAEHLAGVFQTGQERTAVQDMNFCLEQLVEIAIRALSPGINDPFTAMRCISKLGEALCQLFQRQLPSPYRHDKERRLRVLTPPVNVDAVLGIAFHQIREYGKSNIDVMLHLKKTLERLLPHTRRSADLAAVQRHLLLVQSTSLDVNPQETQRYTAPPAAEHN